MKTGSLVLVLLGSVVARAQPEPIPPPPLEAVTPRDAAIADLRAELRGVALEIETLQRNDGEVRRLLGFGLSFLLLGAVTVVASGLTYLARCAGACGDADGALAMIAAGSIFTLTGAVVAIYGGALRKRRTRPLWERYRALRLELRELR